MIAWSVFPLKTNRIPSYITIFNLIVTPLVFLPNQSFIDNYYFPKHVIIMVCSVLFILQIWFSRNNLKELFVWDKTTKAILIYLAIITVSLLFAVDPTLAIAGNSIRQEGYATILMYVLMFFAARASMKIDRKIYVGMLLSATIIAFYGILQKFGIEFFQIESFRSPYITYGTIGNQNFLGSYLVLMLPFAVHFWFAEAKKIALLAYATLLFCLFATMSRGPWLGAIGALSAYMALRFLLFREKTFLKRSLFFILVTIVTILVYFLLFGDSLVSRFLMIFFDFWKIILNDPASSDAGSYRWFIWSKVMELIKERPIFGFGISNLSLIFKSRFPVEIAHVFGYVVEIDEAHNEYLDIAVSSGIPAMLAYLYFLFTVTYSRLKIPKYLDGFNLPILAAIIGYMIQAFFNISIISVAYLFWILLGLFTRNILMNKMKSN
jgi:O-antigen ligase